jgi:hypothetical protein
MGEGVPDLYYAEGPLDAVARSDRETLDRYQRVWHELRAKALDIFQSRGRIDRYLAELPGGGVETGKVE